MKDIKQIRLIRSFVRREGRLTANQKRGLDELLPIVGLKISNQPIDLKSVFGRSSEVILEIGFGMGGSLLEMAKAAPEKDFIGVEVHRPGIGALLSRMKEEGVENIRIYQEDALLVLKQSIPDASLNRVHIFFPDPWPKKRHHKRRLIQPAVVELIHQKLKMGGVLHLATDWEPYARHMMTVLSAANGFDNVAGKGEFALNEGLRPSTKFEARGKRLGHGVWDLVFCNSPACG